MAIQYEPSFWGLLGDALNQGTSGFLQGRQRRLDEEEREYRRRMEKLGVMSSLFNQGAVDNTAVNEAGSAAGMTLNAQPNQPQLRRQIMGRQDLTSPVPFGTLPTTTKVKGSLTATDDEREAAGMTPVSELESRKLGNMDKRQGMAKDAQGMAIEQRKDTDDRYTGDASRQVDDAIAKYGGGQITAKNVGKITQGAFTDYVRSRTAAGSPLTSSELAMLQPYFAKAAQERLQQNEMLRIRYTDAVTFSPNSGAANTAYVRLAGQINARMAIVQREKAALQGSLQALMKDPTTMAKLADLERQQQVLNQAQAKLMAEDVTSATQMLLEMDTPLASTGTPASAPTPAPAANPKPSPSPNKKGGKRVIDKDQKEYLQSIGKWDPYKFEVK
jgi:hypothetical protein